jgi:DNA-binding cell septation regulator SpoVG
MAETATEVKTSLDIRINLVPAEDSKVKAYASIRVELPVLGTFALNHIRIVGGKNGLFVSCPSQASKDKEGNILKDENNKDIYYDHFHPLTKEGRAALNVMVLEAYEKKLAEA